MPPSASTRAQTRLTGRYVRATPGSRSLERGLDLLRTFRLGTSVLTNAELALRSGLPRPTVSRLARSLVEAGFLVYDHGEQGYRLGPVCLSLALSYRSAHRPLDVALPLMRGLAEGRRINVGLAVLDRTEMVYLDSVRLSRMGVFRRLVPGSRIPAAVTSLGHAYMASMTAPDRRALFRQLSREHGDGWPALRRQIDTGIRQVGAQGYCWAQWQAGSLAIAAPLREPNGQRYALNISMSIQDNAVETLVATYAGPLLALADAIERAWRSS